MPEPASEFERIASLLTGLPQGRGVVVGPGDDAAVLRLDNDRDLVATTDTFVEGRHFRRDQLTPTEIGTRLAAANLSDLAAMAAVPRWALVAVVASVGWTAADCEDLERACAAALAADGAAIVGGNLAAGDTFSVTVTLLGEVERGCAWTRSGARPGDVLAVTGYPGNAMLALFMDAWQARMPDPVRRRYVSPPSRIGLARALAVAGGVTAAIDLSDGISSDLLNLCQASGVGARIEDARFPTDAAMEQAARDYAGAGSGGSLLSQLRYGSNDDYELLLALAADAAPRCADIARVHGAPFTVVGEVVASPGIVVRDASGDETPLEPRGWDHFRPPPRR